MKCDGVKRMLTCMAWALGGYILLQVIIYGALPFWKWKSGELGLAMLTVSACCLLIEDIKKFLVQIVAFAMLWMSPVFIGMIAGQPLSVIMQYRTISFAFILSSLFIIIRDFLPYRNVRKICSFLFYGATFLVTTVILGYYASSGSLLNASAVMAVFQTNPAEAKSYLDDFVPWQVWTAVLILLLAYVIVLNKWKLSVARIHGMMHHRAGKALLLFCILLAIFSLYRTRDTFYKHLTSETRQGLKAYTDFSLYREARATDLTRELDGVTSTRPGVYILVIGESQNKMHMSAYGYDRETTPWLDSMKKDGHTVFFRDARSCHTHTVPVLSYALTAKNQYDSRNLTKAVTLIEAAKAAGYETIWISNQVRYGAWDTPTSAIASEADKQEWLNTHVGETTETTAYDGALVDRLANIKPERKTLIVIHLMGNHGSYRDRYPQDAAVFDGDAPVDLYDNSIRYNDSVVQHIYETAKAMPDFQGLVYCADHADDVDCNLGHDASHFTQDMTKIPFYMIFSDAYVRENPDAVQELKAHEGNRVTNDLLFNEMLAVMGIVIPQEYEKQNDLTSPAYDSDKLRFRTLHGQKELD
ncbi:phosphoethanolamine transferase [uncultured Mitsuokella sp.]|uniref:phosphoethanolamine transferase n=1 Tax=uncultured Mitsuokella sp. TaxID=453120 RepID=UPI002599BBF2|nr:phosphoethanolamine transferase [uncultured Mitsuokella sp.]